ncbi:uncharacterized protein [Antedon mediterranea]|uniref:uncharacterized protein n=1 Tax=Antedon mediterranea TaxID=105859 RepID=UPI003AF431C9
MRIKRLCVSFTSRIDTSQCIGVVQQLEEKKMLTRRVNLSCFLIFHICILLDVVVAPAATCASKYLCPLPNGVPATGFENGNVIPWPPAMDTNTEEPCLPQGKKYMKFTCNEGFRLKAKEIHLSCDDSFNWNLEAPTCVQDVPPPPPPPPPPHDSSDCTDSVCEDYYEEEEFISDTDSALVIVIIVLAVLLILSWLFFLLFFICRRETSVVKVQETVYISEQQPTLVKGSNDSLSPSARPPMPKPRDDTMGEPDPEYEYVDREKFKREENKPVYLELIE